LVCAY